MEYYINNGAIIEINNLLDSIISKSHIVGQGIQVCSVALNDQTSPQIDIVRSRLKKAFNEFNDIKRVLREERGCLEQISEKSSEYENKAESAINGINSSLKRIADIVGTSIETLNRFGNHTGNSYEDKRGINWDEFDISDLPGIFGLIGGAIQSWFDLKNGDPRWMAEAGKTIADAVGFYGDVKATNGSLAKWILGGYEKVGFKEAVGKSFKGAGAFSTVFSLILNYADNVQESAENGQSAVRTVQETFTETGVDIAAVAAISTAISAFCPVAAPVAAFAWMLTNFAADNLIGESITEWVSDIICDTTEIVVGTAYQVGKTIVKWKAKIIEGAVDFGVKTINATKDMIVGAGKAVGNAISSFGRTIGNGLSKLFSW